MAAKFVCRVPIASDAVDVKRRDGEVEAVRDAVRDHDGLGAIGVESQASSQAVSGRVRSKIAQSDNGASVGDGQVVVVAQMHMDAAQYGSLGANHVPLNGFEPWVPFLPEDLGQTAAGIAMGREVDQANTYGYSNLEVA